MKKNKIKKNQSWQNRTIPSIGNSGVDTRGVESESKSREKNVRLRLRLVKSRALNWVPFD